MAKVSNDNPAFMQSDAIPIDGELMLLRKYPKWVHDYVIFHAPMDLNILEFSKSFPNSSEAIIPIVYSSVYSAIYAHSSPHSIVDQDTVKAMLDKRIVKLVHRIDFNEIYHTAVQNYRSEILAVLSK